MRGVGKRRYRRAYARTAAAWRWDEDGWLCRRLRATDHGAAAFINSWHAFIGDGMLYCRNRHQAAALDLGGMV